MYLAEYPDKLMLLDGASRADIPHLKDFIEHIRYSMKEYIMDISVPFNIMSPKIRQIREKYKNNDYVMNYKKKSLKIN